MLVCWRKADITPNFTKNNSTKMQRWLERQWYRVGPWHLLLLPLSWVFYLLVRLRRLLYQQGMLKTSKLPVPVVVVGNINVGGTGKTPLVIWLVEYLRQQGYCPGVISRGYGGMATQPLPVSTVTNPVLAGDEPVLIARRTGCPVWVGRNRVEAGRALLRASPDCNVLVCDDGLQHYALAREVEIVVVDGARRFGNGLMLPAGPLREPKSRLAQADAVMINGGGTSAVGLSMALEGGLFRNLSDPTRSAIASDFSGQLLHAVAGIGNPSRFFEQLAQLGLPVQPHAFPDHHPYQPEDLQFAGTQGILMTEKDAVKCAAFAQPSWWYLEVNAKVDEALGLYVMQKLRS